MGPRQVEYDLRFLVAVLNWATQAANDEGVPLLERNPLKGLPFPKEENPRRPMLTQKQYTALQRVAPTVDWRFELALTLVHETGHRIGAVRTLRWSDIDTEAKAIVWRADTDKLGMAHVTPLTTIALSGLKKARQWHAAIGDAWVFPSPVDQMQPCSRNIMRDWWNRARAQAGVDGIRGRGWHALRRKFASELKDVPLRDLCELGGWKDPQTILKCYQQPDERTMRAALANRRPL